MATRPSSFCFDLCRAQVLSLILRSWSPGTKHTQQADHRTRSPGDGGHQRKRRPGACPQEAYNLVDDLILNSGNVLNSLQRCVKLGGRDGVTFQQEHLCGPDIFTWILFPSPETQLPIRQASDACGNSFETNFQRGM